MADLHLIWYTLDDFKITAPRADVMQWADELGLNKRTSYERPNTSGIFDKVCTTIQHTYTDDDGAPRVAAGRESARKGEFITYECTREDGMVIGQLKYFSARKARTGIVAGTFVLKSMIRRNLSVRDTEAARAWIEKVEAAFRTEQGYLPWHAIRRMVRGGILSAAVPMSHRRTTFFAYDDDLEAIIETRDFLAKAVPNADLAILPIEDGADLTLFARSADDWLSEMTEAFMARVAGYIHAPSNARRNKTTDWVGEVDGLHWSHRRHERRLALDLPKTRSALLKANQLMGHLPSSPHLPYVSRR